MGIKKEVEKNKKKQKNKFATRKIHIEDKQKKSKENAERVRSIEGREKEKGNKYWNLIVLIFLVSDFGFGQFFGAHETWVESGQGTPLWMAPETMLGQKTNEKSDVYR